MALAEMKTRTILADVDVDVGNNALGWVNIKSVLLLRSRGRKCVIHFMIKQVLWVNAFSSTMLHVSTF